MERGDDRHVMDENPYRSLETVGAGQPGILAVLLKRLVWFCLAMMGAFTAGIGLLMVGVAVFQSMRNPRIATIAFGAGSISCWMGAFLVWRAAKRFRGRVQARIDPYLTR